MSSTTPLSMAAAAARSEAAAAARMAQQAAMRTSSGCWLLGCRKPTRTLTPPSWARCSPRLHQRCWPWPPLSLRSTSSACQPGGWHILASARSEVTLVSTEEVVAIVSSSLGRSPLRAACVGLPMPLLADCCDGDQLRSTSGQVVLVLPFCHGATSMDGTPPWRLAGADNTQRDAPTLCCCCCTVPGDGAAEAVGERGKEKASSPWASSSSGESVQ
mmetsp:Transcript_15836/g.44308  ORF Transcript_15836/g.44308 Transcript_15836/m.44308 type:complete len:216 (-) Transcript_15836:733-1380(-)